MKTPQHAAHAKGPASHLQAALGPGALWVTAEKAAVVASAGLEPGVAPAALATMQSTRERFISLLHSLQIKPGLTHQEFELGLFAKKNDYEAYLKQEGLGGLSGSLGATHPVRLVSVVLAEPAALQQVSAQVVIAHELVHLMTLKSGLCPSWEAWPRWLHEGLAMQLDYRAGLPDPGKNNAKPNQTLISRNPDRAGAWSKIANRLDIREFLKRDLTRNPSSHQDDYAASWAITAALLEWQQGRLFSAFLDELARMQMQYEAEQSLESLSCDWLVNELGSAWPDFLKTVKSI